jgi:hypothetical protein
LFTGTRRFWPALLILAVLVVGACTQTRSYQAAITDGAPPDAQRVLLLPPDIELSELSAGGVLTPKAAWTETAKSNIDTAIDAALADRVASIVPYARPADDDPSSREFIKLEKLNQVVGQSIMAHKYSQPDLLPTKKDMFDWSLGPGIGLLARDTNADHALFVHFRDTFSSDDRRALQIFAAVLGVGIPGGTQVGFASIVDLKTGDVVWFNRLISTVGDLRKPDKAGEAVDTLLSEAPL